MAMADTWVSLVSTGEVRDFVWALRDCTGVSQGLTQLLQVCTGISLDCTGGVTIIHSSAGRWRQCRTRNPVHAALIKGVGDSKKQLSVCPVHN